MNKVSVIKTRRETWYVKVDEGETNKAFLIESLLAFFFLLSRAVIDFLFCGGVFAWEIAL